MPCTLFQKCLPCTGAAEHNGKLLGYKLAAIEARIAMQAADLTCEHGLD